MAQPERATGERVDGEPGRLLELMSDDIVYDDTAWPTTMRGHDDVRKVLQFAWDCDARPAVRDGEAPYLVAGERKAAF